MSHEFLDFVEDILDAMDKAEILLEGFTYEVFEIHHRGEIYLMMGMMGMEAPDV